MKAKTLLLALLLASGSALLAQKADTNTKILDLEKKWTDAYRFGDTSMLNSLLTEDFIITVEDGATYSKAGYLTHAIDPNTKVEIAEISDVRVRPHGSTIVVTGAYHEKGKTKGKPYEFHDRFTDVWMETSAGKWQLVASHFSVPNK